MNGMSLSIVASDDHMVLPRILQIMSRRGCRLTQLKTEPQGSEIRYTCELVGDEKWNDLLPLLIAKLPDVKEVRRGE